MNRRQFLTTTGATAVSVVAAPFTRSAGATTQEDWRSDNVREKNISFEYNETFLRRYRPVFVARRDVIRRYKGLFGYKVTSPEYDYDYAYYWSQLTHQDGLPFVRKDAHLGDHEPILCAVDPSTGDLERVTWTAYHHYAGRARPGQIQVVADETTIETHPVFKIDSRWHNFYPDYTDQWTRGNFPLRNWLAVRDSWIRNDTFARTSWEAIEDPEVMDSGERDSWWRDGTIDAHFARLWAFLGIGGIDETEFATV